MEAYPLVSGIITTHKRSADIVERALKSILQQTYDKIEIIVVDDSPADYAERKTVEETVLLYKDRGVRYIPHEKSRGACAARNTGLAAASGSFVGFLDDDDEWEPTKVEEMLPAFSSEDIALVYSDRRVVYETPGPAVMKEKKYYGGKVFDRLIIENFIGNTSNPLLRKNALLDIGGFDVLMQSAQDYDVWLRLSEQYSVAFVKKQLSVYYFHAGEQITRNPGRKIAGYERLNEKNAAYLDAHRIAKWNRNKVIIPYYAMERNLGKAIELWIGLIKLSPESVYGNLKVFGGILKNYFGSFHRA